MNHKKKKKKQRRSNLKMIMSRKYLYVSVVCSYGFHVLITFRYEMEQGELTNRTTRTTATVHAENNQDNKGINLLTMNSFIKTASHSIPCTSSCPPPMTLHPDRGCVLEGGSGMHWRGGQSGTWRNNDWVGGHGMLSGIRKKGCWWLRYRPKEIIVPSSSLSSSTLTLIRHSLSVESSSNASGRRVPLVS